VVTFALTQRQHWPGRIRLGGILLARGCVVTPP
jgi:hypothetical protein